MKDIHVLNLGAGVQSTVLALMSMRGDIQKFNVAIFADTQEEPKAVYEHLGWLMSETAGHFPTIIKTAGRIGDDLKDGGSRRSHGTLGFAPIPAFTSGKPGKAEGMLQRQCTKEYKTEVVQRAIRRDLIGLKRGERMPKDVMVYQYLGLSYDEPRRVLGVRRRFQEFSWSECRFPLFEMEMTRRGCVAWLKNNYPHRDVPRSACVFCPYHSNDEWLRIKETDPEGWARSIEIDEALRGEALAARNISQKMYLHRSCVPLAEVDLRDVDTRKGQEIFGFASECEGMCGL